MATESERDLPEAPRDGGVEEGVKGEAGPEGIERQQKRSS
jgi:hypothetical protein